MKKEKWSFNRILAFCASIGMGCCLIIMPFLSKLGLLILTVPFALYSFKMAYDTYSFKTNEEFDDACANSGDIM